MPPPLPLLLLLVIDRGGPSHSASVSATTPGPFDLDEDKGLRAAVDAVGSELVLLTTNAGGVTSAVNMALQLRRVGLTAVLVLHPSAAVGVVPDGGGAAFKGLSLGSDAPQDCERHRPGELWLRCGNASAGGM